MLTNHADASELNDLVNSLKNHEENSLERLYDLFAPAVYGWVKKHVKNTNTAEEVLRDTFLNVRKNIHLYDGSKTKLLIWIIQLSNGNSHMSYSIKLMNELNPLEASEYVSTNA